MSQTIHPVFSQELPDGRELTFGIGDDGKAYWNGKPIVTEEKVVLQSWLNMAIVITAIAAAAQAIFAGLAYFRAPDTSASAVASKAAADVSLPGDGEAPAGAKGAEMIVKAHTRPSWVYFARHGQFIKKPQCAHGTEPAILTTPTGPGIVLGTGRAFDLGDQFWAISVRDTAGKPLTDGFVFYVNCRPVA